MNSAPYLSNCYIAVQDHDVHEYFAHDKDGDP